MYIYINYTLLLRACRHEGVYICSPFRDGVTKIHKILKISSADEFKHTMDSQLEHQSRKQQKLMDYTKYTCYTIIEFTNKSA